MTISALPRAPVALAILLAVPFWLAGCHEADDPSDHAPQANAVTTMPEMGTSTATNAARPESWPTPAASPAASDALKGEKGARALLLDWGHALERRDWVAARRAWGHGGADSGLSPEDFAAAYDKYASATVSIGDGNVEGAAGSLYYEVPVTVTGALRNGRRYRLEGPVVVRRVNDVDGATPQELTWHISQSGLKPKP